MITLVGLILAISSLSLAIMILAFVVLGLLGEFLGAPYVPTTQKEIDEILSRAKLKKGQLFLELGSGDGRITRAAVKKYQVSGIGVEIHPMLVLYSRIKSKLEKLKSIQFLQQNIFKTDFSQADVIFLFLMPKTIKKLQERMIQQTKKGAVIVSHGFMVPALAKYQFDVIDETFYPTYYYRL